RAPGLLTLLLLIVILIAILIFPRPRRALMLKGLQAMKLATHIRARERGKTPGNGSRLISRKRISTYCDALAREFRPQKIVLFGSYAYGRPTPDSDVDLLVILPFRGNDVAKAVQIRSRFDTPFPMDLLVRKPEFI